MEGLISSLPIFLSHSRFFVLPIDLRKKGHSVQVISNQEAVDIVKKIKNPQKAAKQLVTEALNRESKDDISCIVVRF